MVSVEHMKFWYVLSFAVMVLIGLVWRGITGFRSGTIRKGLWRACIRLFGVARMSSFASISETRSGFDDACRHYDLTPREQDVVRLIVQGCSNQQIADELGVTVSTIKKHITKAYQKCQVKGRDEMMTLFSTSSDKSRNDA